MAQSVTTLSPLIKHGSWAGVSIQSVMMKNAMRVKAVQGSPELACVSCKENSMRMVSIVWCVGLIALSALGTAQAQTNPIQGTPGSPFPSARPNEIQIINGYLAGRCMIDSRKLASLLRAPAMSQSVGSTDRREPRRVVGRLPSDLVKWRSDPRVARRPMSRRCKDPLRALTPEERKELRRLSRSHSVPATAVDRARALPRLPMGPVTPPPPGRSQALKPSPQQKDECYQSHGEAHWLRGTPAVLTNVPIMVRTARVSPARLRRTPPGASGFSQPRRPGALSTGMHPSRQRRVIWRRT